MAEPLSVAASLAGITVPALHVLHILLDDFARVRDAQKTIRHRAEGMKAFVAISELLEKIEDQKWQFLGTSIAEQVRITIGCCT